jgi:hypothetical protein
LRVGRLAEVVVALVYGELVVCVVQLRGGASIDMIQSCVACVMVSVLTTSLSSSFFLRFHQLRAAAEHLVRLLWYLVMGLQLSRLLLFHRWRWRSIWLLVLLGGLVRSKDILGIEAHDCLSLIICSLVLHLAGHCFSLVGLELLDELVIVEIELIILDKSLRCCDQVIRWLI